MSDVKPTKFSFENEFSDFFDVAVMDGLATPVRAQAKNAQDSYDTGFREGLAQGRAEGDAELQQELVTLRQQVEALTTRLTQSQADWQHVLARHAMTLLRASLHRLAGHAAEHYSDQLLEHHLKYLLANLHHGDNLTLRINPQAKGYHEKLGLPHANIGGIPFRIVTDPALGVTDVVVEWPQGGMESRLVEHLAQLDGLLASAGADVSLPVPELPVTSQLKVEEPPSPLNDVAAATQQRAQQLLGDDELVDALK